MQDIYFVNSTTPRSSLEVQVVTTPRARSSLSGVVEHPVDGFFLWLHTHAARLVFSRFRRPVSCAETSLWCEPTQDNEAAPEELSQLVDDGFRGLPGASWHRVVVMGLDDASWICVSFGPTTVVRPEW